MYKQIKTKHSFNIYSIAIVLCKTYTSSGIPTLLVGALLSGYLYAVYFRSVFIAESELVKY